MSSIIYIKNKNSGITYAYESESYWSKEAKAPRTRRTYLGRVDENGNIIPKKDKSAKKAGAAPDPADGKNYKKLYEQSQAQIHNLTAEIQSLKASLISAQKSLAQLSKAHSSQGDYIENAISSIDSALKRK